MAKLTPIEFAEKYATRMTNATSDIARGIARVTTSPTKKAAAKKDKMLANLTKAVNDGRWQKGLEKVSLEEWQTKAIEVGVPRIAAGVNAAKSKMEAFASKLIPAQEALMREIDKMPDITLEDKIARSAAWQRGMAKLKGQFT